MRAENSANNRGVRPSGSKHRSKVPVIGAISLALRDTVIAAGELLAPHHVGLQRGEPRRQTYAVSRKQRAHRYSMAAH